MKQWRNQFGVLVCDTWDYSDPRPVVSSIRMGRRGIRLGTYLSELCMYQDNYNHLKHKGITP